MAENLVIESPDFDQIQEDAGGAARDAIKLLWSVLNQEISLRRKVVRDAKETIQVKVLTSGATANQDNFDHDRATVVYFTGASNFNLTGLRNGSEGMIKILFNAGTGTITIKNNVTSDTLNRLLTSTGADKSLTTDQSIIFLYANSRWREVKIL